MSETSNSEHSHHHHHHHHHHRRKHRTNFFSDYIVDNSIIEWICKLAILALILVGIGLPLKMRFHNEQEILSYLGMYAGAFLFFAIGETMTHYNKRRTSLTLVRIGLYLLLIAVLCAFFYHFADLIVKA